MLFSEMKLQPEVQAALQVNKYETATAIQEQVIALALQGKNVVGLSQTGTGKTAAFVIPLLELVDGKIRRPQAIVLAPTRELASQIRDEVFKLSTGMRIRSAVVVGGTSFRKQREIIDQGPQIVIATPGRLIDLIDKGFIDLAQVKYFVLDECDRMLDMGFIDDIDYLWSHLPKIEQSMTFSATIPTEMSRLLAKYVGATAGVDYEFVKATEELVVAKIDHSFIEVETFDKFELLKTYIERFAGKKVIVFSRTKHETEHLARILCDNGISAGFLHGDMEQRQRTRALRAFKEDEIQVFVTTDVAARGLNMNNIDLVVNFHVPEDPEAYIHRIGRTGRAGAEGHAIMFVSPGEKMMLKNVERRNKITLKQVDAQGNPLERKIEDPRSGFGGGGRGRGGRSSGGYQGGRGGRSGGGGYQWGGGRDRFGGSRSHEGFASEGSAPASGGYAGHAAPREGGYQGGGQGGYQWGGRSSGGGYQGGGRSGGGGYQGGGRSGGGYQGGGRGGRAPEAPSPGRYAGGGASTGGSAGGDFSVFGG